MNIILWDYESVYDPMFDLKIFVGYCDLYISWFSDFALYLGNYSVAEHHTFGITSQYDPTSDLKIFVGHCDLYFLVH